jgi:hypothetical protein
MSRRIATVFALAASATFVAPAAADRECFDNICKMPEVIEAPAAPAAPAEPVEASQSTDTAPQTTEQRPSAPEPIRPHMVVDQLPRPALKPSPYRPVEPMTDKSMRDIVREVSREAPNGPVEVVGRRYAAVEQQTYAANSHPTQPGAGVVVVVPGVQYGADGVGLEQGRQDSSWELCQSDRRSRGRCGPYNYQPFGAYGYRPLGDYRQYRPAPSYVYVPDARVITIDTSD